MEEGEEEGLEEKVKKKRRTRGREERGHKLLGRWYRRRRGHRGIWESGGRGGRKGQREVAGNEDGKEKQ